MDIPRRIRHDLHTPAEKAITEAMVAVEEVGADVLLTEAVCLLSDARDKLSDYVDRELKRERDAEAAKAERPDKITVTVTLNALGGGLAAQVEVLPFTTRPRAIIWGTRFFIDTGYNDDDGFPIYVEEFVAYALPTMEREGARGRSLTINELREQRNSEHECKLGTPRIMETTSGLGDFTLITCICGNQSQTTGKEEAIAAASR